MSTWLQKQYISSFPACNVLWHNEAVATDTVCSDTPDIDNGATCAQILLVKTL